MLFSSFEFLVFFVVYFLLRAALPGSLQLGLLIVGSTFFYAYWNPVLVWVPLLLVLMTYLSSFFIMSENLFGSRKLRLGISIAALLTPLCFFKYAFFLSHSIVEPLTGYAISVEQHPLPLGISFITFTMIAFLVDVYKSEFPLVKSLPTMAGYTMFFPQLIAGPILRPGELIPQLDDLKRNLPDGFLLGVGYFAVGLVKKCLFADTFGQVADTFFANPTVVAGWDALLGVLAFTVQIYCDFSGYTDMAIGSALVLGITLPENFDRPYMAASVADFWRRWHITLSNWIRDYIYIPLGGNRKGGARQMVNLFIAMSLCGLWHGADWTFVVWGALHGLGVASCHIWKKLGLSMPRAAGIALTFVFVAFGWVLFRAQDMAAAVEVYGVILSADYSRLIPFVLENAGYLCLLAVFFAAHPFDVRDNVRAFIGRTNRYAYLGAIATVVVLTLAFNFGSSNEFIYFDF